jgi:hypothetical protein
LFSRNLVFYQRHTVTLRPKAAQRSEYQRICQKIIKPLAGQLTGSNSRKTSADITILPPVVRDASPNRLPLLKEIAKDVLDEQKDKSYFYSEPNAAERDK